VPPQLAVQPGGVPPQLVVQPGGGVWQLCWHGGGVWQSCRHGGVQLCVHGVLQLLPMQEVPRRP
jgi:hypothetical protein